MYTPYTNGRPEDDRNATGTCCHSIIWRIILNITKAALTVDGVLYRSLNRKFIHVQGQADHIQETLALPFTSEYPALH